MENTNALAVVNRPIIATMDDAERAAKAMAGSGFFKDAAQVNQAVVKILAGQELGFGPFASMNGIYIVSGKPSYSANIMAAAVKRSGRYNYRVLEMSDTVCEIAFFEGREEIGRSKFTKEDATRAGTQNMNKFPRNMLFARAMSNGVRWYCPDVFNGSAVYTPEELGATVNEDGDVIDVQPTTTGTNGNGNKPTQEQAGETPLRQQPEILKANLTKLVSETKKPYAQEADCQSIAATLETVLGGEEKRKELLQWLFGKNSMSRSKPEYVGDAATMALMRWLKPTYDRDNHVFTCDPMAAREAVAAHNAALAVNQGSLLDPTPEAQ